MRTDGRTAKWRFVLAALGVLLPLLLLPLTPAKADDVADPVALDLFQRGRRLIKEGDWDGGCAAIDASLKRSVAVSAVLNLALCQEHAGKIASAWATVERALVLNRETDGDQRRAELTQAAEEILARIKPRLSRLRVVVVPPTEGARVMESGRELPLDTPVPLDPGAHALSLTAPGHDEAVRNVELREGEVLSVELSFRADDAPKPPAPVPVADAPAQPVEQRAIVPVWVWITGGVGVVSTGFAIAFAVDASNAASALEDRCGTDLICNEDPTFDPDPENARKNRGLGLAIGLGVLGVGGLVAGLAGLGVALTHPKKPPPVSVWSGPGQFGIGVQARF